MRLLRLLAMSALYAGSAAAGEIQVHAAASLSDALADVGAAYARRTGTIVRFNFAASSTICRQIEQGAPGDVFVSADEARMDELAARNLIVASTRRRLLSNVLVVVVPDDSDLPLRRVEDLAGPRFHSIAIAQPDLVPAGVYAKQFLVAAGLWSRLAPKLVPTENVRATLAAVEAGNVDAGFVYRTDAAMARRARLALVLSGAGAPRISYPAAVLSESKQGRAAGAFVAYLDSAEARQIFTRHGFIVN